eukprot:CAMPEP_0168734112 /NCGR_PEP_ID=MMETSP0724-20121128/8642_1 /TAXON_ID=265536 /ORGANISM="Amphiprora sp., Strain CCMP467" /LENGTH=416 /DNA_ID=CAMNT_0008781199 /DNA_START=57 /DNA_END=1307 /DNA_ORIENTATION=+
MATHPSVAAEEEEDQQRQRSRKLKQNKGRDSKRKRQNRSKTEATRTEPQGKEAPESTNHISPKPTVRDLTAQSSLSKLAEQAERRASSSTSTQDEESPPQDFPSAPSSLGSSSSSSSTGSAVGLAASQTLTVEATSTLPTSSPSPATAGLHHLSGAAAILASAMNDPTQHLTSTTPASQRQLLSALLAEGIGSGRTLDALQASPAATLVQSSSTSPAQTLDSVNRALQQQLLIGELLKQQQSPSAPGPAASVLQLQLLQQQQQLASLGLIHSPGVDMLLAQPKMNLLAPGMALEGAIGAPPLFTKKDESKIGKDEEKADTAEKKKRHSLPPRKRRKMVNFQLESDFPQHEGDNSKITFPLPVQEKKESQALVHPSLASYKKLWSSLEKTSGEQLRQELFRRRLGQGRVSIVKNKST